LKSGGWIGTGNNVDPTPVSGSSPSNGTSSEAGPGQIGSGN
jgi:hypothetical protein